MRPMLREQQRPRNDQERNQDQPDLGLRRHVFSHPAEELK